MNNEKKLLEGYNEMEIDTNNVKYLIEIENQISHNVFSNSTKNYYNFVELHNLEIIKIYKIISTNTDFKKYFKEIKYFIEEFQINYNFLIKNKNDYISFILSVFIVKSFVDQTFIKSEDDEIDKNNLIYESDKIINNILYNINNFNKWLEIFFNKNSINKIRIDLSNQSIRKGILFCITILEESKFIKIKKTNCYKNKFKTLNFYEYHIEFKNFIFLELYTESFQKYIDDKNEIYIYINHYTNVYEVLKKNNLSNQKFKINNNAEFLNNLLKIKVKLDYESLEYYFNIKLKELNLEKNKINYYYTNIIKELKNSIKNNDSVSISDYSKKLSQILELNRIQKMLLDKFNDFIYIPFTICFRGRIYFKSSISITSYKEFRYCIHLGEYENNWSQPYHRFNKRIEEHLNKHIEKIKNIKKYDFSNKSINVKHSILWILISVAEMDKKKLGIEVELDDFINHGIRIINNVINLDLKDVHDKLRLYSLEKILNEINKDVYIKRLISKDATASCFQHLIKILGPKSDESLKICNLMSEYAWYDTYTFIKKKWFDKNKYINDGEEKNKIIEELFNRKAIKHPLMTTQYGASKNRCLEYFKNNNSNISNHDIEQYINEFNNFHEFINGDVGIFNKNPKEIINALLIHDYIIKLTDKCESNLNYYKCEIHQIKITYKGKRKTKNERKLSSILNNKKMKTSIRANYIHIHDSATIRFLLMIIPILIIHDSVLQDYRSITFTIALLNEAMQKIFHDLNLTNMDHNKIFSIFIFL